MQLERVSKEGARTFLVTIGDEALILVAAGAGAGKTPFMRYSPG